MDELDERIVGKTGVDAEVARKAGADILKFLQTDGPGTKVQGLIDALPGASAAIGAAPPVGGGVMGAFGALTGASLGMGQVQGVTREFIDFARAKVGKETVDEVVGAIPGLSQFV